MVFEFDILNWIQTLHSPLLDKVMTLISTLGNSGFIFILVGLVFLIRKKDRKMGITILMSLILCLVFGNMLLKPLIARPRPFTIKDIELLIKAPTDFSFPSGHTYSAFATATSLYLYNKKPGVGFFIFAAIMGFSRLYLYVHYPTDVLAGAVIGVGFGIISRQIVDYLEKRLTR
ncbi:phosphatase PAP2 family protein [Anaerosphaera multitolerans]|uniref:Phosphatase PAP2 family protein n=1 Tax=Anaerosphaera multitolerans TaxID=2487351 RepID=A0A437S993_9FIRM|nr:phosphatase PAP2 family protein [Anaerosphaera multitolerans]RVU55685.1 phosphatase PAP2 family protein [Anaerosphaera multitolerans]